MDRVRFKVNGNSYSVGCEVSSTMMLVDYVRDTLELHGTKYMCREAGCGACIVAVTKCNGGPVMAVNSCIVPVTLCNEWDITTIEHLGNRKKGYHILQKTLAEYSGTQCGYCSPAWIMNMYSFLQGNRKPTKLEIERAFGSNVCRCTGYRPILDAFKTFSKEEQSNSIPDIEEFTICTKSGVTCTRKCDDDGNEWCILSKKDFEEDHFIQIQLEDGKCWYGVNDLNDIFKILNSVGNQDYMLVNGNTAKGVYPILEYPTTLIDITAVKELKDCKLDQNLIIGAGVTITELENILNTTADTVENFKYLKKLVEHIQYLGHIPIRNQASVAGNLMIKHQHNEFLSDLYLLFETVDAYVNIVSSDKQYKSYSMQEFLKVDMIGKVLVHVLLPPLSDKHKLVTFKIASRFQNCNTFVVKAGFLYKLSDDEKVEEARIVYGELCPKSYRASCTENFLIGKPLFDNLILQSALVILNNETQFEDHPLKPSIEYRRKVTLSMFYKGLLSLSPSDCITPSFRSGSKKIHSTRPVSTAKQVFDTDTSLWPLNQPIPKVEALIQCAGEAEYIDNLPPIRDEVHAAFVLSTVGAGIIVKIDASEALSYPGVLAFYTASDIPGINSFTPAGTEFYVSNEEILCSGVIRHYNQPVAIIVAKNQAIANIASKKVTITYTNNTDTPIVIDLKKAIKDPKRLTLTTSKDATGRGNDVVKTIKGENTTYGQYHFAMENISCVSRPTEEGLQIFATTQWCDGIRLMTSKVLLIPENHIDVYIRRLGGAFGIKVSRAIQVVVACSLVTYKLNKSCRFVLPLIDTMRAVGKRMGCHSQFDCDVSDKGVIQHLDYKVYEDNGYILSETLSMLFIDLHNNCYNNTNWNFKLYDAVTDIAKTTFCRAPGTLEAVAMAELLMERISYELSLDPFEVRFANLDTTKYNDLKKIVENLKQSASYDERRTKVNLFNSNNRWTKRGLRVSFLRWTPFGPPRFDISLSICHGDGSVIITHGGVEMGQGVNTKSVQICAYYFKIPIEKVQIKANSTTVSPNNFQSGGSLTSQSTGIGIRKACLEMLKRLEPIRNKMDNPTWEELIKQAYDDDVDLHVHEYVGIKVTSKYKYDIFGAAIAEVEVDILTGEIEVLRVDLVQDAGRSVNPKIDIGQVEGAFIMGQGYWTTENLIYDSKTGELLTDRTWFYHVPLASDIPQDFRVYLRKKSYSFDEIMGSKATGEPPMCLSVVISFAIREAIASARQDVGIPTTSWFQIDGPMTVEKIRLATQCKSSDFKLN